MAKIPKGAYFRSIQASGVWMVPIESGISMFFVSLESDGLETGDGRPATLNKIAHLQAEIMLDRNLAKWIRDNLNVYLDQKPVEATSQ